MSSTQVVSDTDIRLGEVVEASTVGFVAQCYELYQAPPLGSLVRCGDSYGIVYEIATRSIDSGRRPIARGRDEADEEAIYEANPQLSRLLSTEFSALAVGHREDGALRRWPAPLPPRIHSFARLCSPDELREFTAALDFVSTALSAPIPAADEALAAFLKTAGAAHDVPEAFLVDAGRHLAALLGAETQRLNAFLRRIAP